MAAASHCPPDSSQLADVQIFCTAWLASLVEVKYSLSKSLETMNCLAFLRFNRKNHI